MARSSAFGSVVLAAALVLAACGGDSEESAPDGVTMLLAGFEGDGMMVDGQLMATPASDDAR